MNATSKTAILFDCDGTLVDTEIMCGDVDVEIYHEQGIHFASTDAFLDEFLGVANIDILNLLNKRHGKNIDPDYFLGEFVRRCVARVPTDMRWFPESLEYVKGLAARGIPMAVGSNGKRDIVMRELEVSGYLPIFGAENVLTVEDVVTPKPAPELYLKCTQRLGVNPADCIVVEDSGTGARAGIAAGMRVVGYTGLSHNTERTRAALEKAGCHIIINDLTALERMVA